MKPATLGDVAELGTHQDIEYVMNSIWITFARKVGPKRFAEAIFKDTFYGALGGLGVRTPGGEQEVEAFRFAMSRSPLKNERAVGVTSEALPGDFFHLDFAPRIDNKGRLSLPKHLRSALGPNPVGTINLKNGSLIFRPGKAPRRKKGHP
jgi:hypothetical protein